MLYRNCLETTGFKCRSNVFPIPRKWQTSRTQNPVLARGCGFKSHLSSAFSRAVFLIFVGMLAVTFGSANGDRLDSIRWPWFPLSNTSSLSGITFVSGSIWDRANRVTQACHLERVATKTRPPNWPYRRFYDHLCPCPSILRPAIPHGLRRWCYRRWQDRSVASDYRDPVADIPHFSNILKYKTVRERRTGSTTSVVQTQSRRPLEHGSQPGGHHGGPEGLMVSGLSGAPERELGAFDQLLFRHSGPTRSFSGRQPRPSWSASPRGRSWSRSPCFFSHPANGLDNALVRKP